MKAGPMPNPRFLKVMVVDLLSETECDEIIAALNPKAWATAGISNAEHPYGVDDPNVRSVLSQSVPLREDGWPLTSVVEMVSTVNAAEWRYELQGFVLHDYPSVLRYEGTVADHFQPHTDVGEFNPTRKLSFSVQLSGANDYRGGELLFGRQRDPAMRRRGSMTVFPSLLEHEVTPVYAGRRDVIVGWVHGDTFR